MQRQRGELVPIGDALSVLRRQSGHPSAHQGFTQADQVNQLVGGQRGGPRPGLHGSNDGAFAVCPAPTPGKPAPIQARQRTLHALYDGRRGHKSQRRQARRLGAKEKWQEGWWLGGATRTPSSSSNTSRISVAAGTDRLTTFSIRCAPGGLGEPFSGSTPPCGFCFGRRGRMGRLIGEKL